MPLESTDLFIVRRGSDGLHPDGSEKFRKATGGEISSFVNSKLVSERAGTAVEIDSGGTTPKLWTGQQLQSVLASTKSSIGSLNINPSFLLNNTDYNNFLIPGEREIVTSVAKNSAGALYIHKSRYGGTYLSDNYYPVNADREYRANMTIASSVESISGLPLADHYVSSHYLGVICFDSDKEAIYPQHLTDVAGWNATTKRGNSSTELITEVKNGDTSVHVADASNWHTGTATHRNGLLLHPLRPDGTYGYIGKNGRYYDEHKYSRLVMYLGIDVNNVTQNADSTWTVGLQSPWTLGTFPVGTHIQNSFGGGTYNYWISNWFIPVTKSGSNPQIIQNRKSPWRFWDENIAPYDDPGNYGGNFRNGTAYVKVLGLFVHSLYAYDATNVQTNESANTDLLVHTWYPTISLEWRHKP